MKTEKFDEKGNLVYSRETYSEETNGKGFTFENIANKKDKSSEVLTETAVIGIAYIAVLAIAVVVPAIMYGISCIKKMMNSITENLFSNNVFAGITVKDGVVTLKRMNYRALMNRIDEMYDRDNNDSAIKKIFFIEYNKSDFKKYKKGKIRTKKDCRIKDLSFYEFFSMEMVNMFYALSEYYEIKAYKRIAKAITKKTYLNNTQTLSPFKTKLTDTVKKELEDNPLLDHQKDFVELYPYLKKVLSLRGMILSFDQGLGKTLTGLSLSLQLNKEQVVIVCPNTLTSVWADEICKMIKTYKENPDKAVEDIYVDHDKTKRFLTSKNPKYIIVNNEAIDKIQTIVDKKKDTIIIIDECQNFRYITGSRWANLYKMICGIWEKDKRLDVLPMSGTPIKAKPSEIVPALMCIDPLFIEAAAKMYVKAFDVDNTRAADIISSRFKSIIYRKTKDQVLNLPPKIIETVKFKIKNSEKYLTENVKDEIRKLFNVKYSMLFQEVLPYAREYEQMVRKYAKGCSSKLIEEYIDYLYDRILVGEYKDISEYKLEKFLDFGNKYVRPNIDDKETLKRFNELEKKYVRIRNSAMGLAIGEILPPRRAQMFCDIIKENEEDIIDYIDGSIKKVAMFSNSLQVVKELEEMCKRNEIGYVKITGSNAKDRKSLIDKFKDDDTIDVLIGTNATMGVGVTITCANTELIFGPPWRRADFDQLTDRIHRIGQDTECFIYNMCLDTADKNLSDRMDEIMTWSGEMTNAYIETTGDILVED